MKTECALLKQRIEAVEAQTHTLNNKLDEIVSGINALNINVAKNIQIQIILLKKILIIIQKNYF